MNFMGFGLRRNNKSGIILIVVLWILVILSVVAIGLGRAAHIDLSLAKHRIGKLKADFLMWGAVNYAMNSVRLRAESQTSSTADTLYQCGFELKDKETSEDLFKNVALKDGTFDIRYVLKDGRQPERICYGFQDEERRINLNAIHQGNYQILTNLFVLLDIPEDKAETLAAEIVDWQDADSKTTIPSSAEKDEYLTLNKPYPIKNAPFESIDELLLLKDMTTEIFLKVKDYLTILPQNDIFTINANTAPEIVLKAFFHFLIDQQQSDEWNKDVADSLAEKIVSYRKGDDGIACTADDEAIQNMKIGDLKLFPDESALYFTAANYFKNVSDYLRVFVQGTDDRYAVSSKAEAVISKQSLSFISWERK